MIGIEDLWNPEVGHHKIGTVENKIKLSFGSSAGMGGLPLAVGIDEAGGAEKKIKLFVAPEYIEITGNNHRAFDFASQSIETFKLILSITKGQGEMNKKNGNQPQSGLNHQPLDPLFKIMKTMAADRKTGQDGIALPVEQRHLTGNGLDPIF